MKYIYATKSLKIDVLNSGITKNASELFEYDFVRHLNKKALVEIINYGKRHDVQDCGGFSYVNIELSNILLLCNYIKSVKKAHENVAIVMTGYETREIFIFSVLSKIFRIKTYVFLYDTHKLALASKSLLKRVIGNIYFNIGYLLALKQNGLIVLNDSFIKEEKINAKYLKINVGCTDFNLVEKRKIKQNSKFKILYAGTINKENGADLLCDGIKLNKNTNFIFEIYGDGDFVEEIKNIEKIDSRVKYNGRVSSDVLKVAMRDADLLIGLRNPNGISVNYSFPSKLINFMSTGTPVLTNSFPGLDEDLKKCVYVLQEYSQKELFAVIEEIKNNYDCDIGKSALQHLRLYNSWDVIVSNFIRFTNIPNV